MSVNLTRYGIFVDFNELNWEGQVRLYVEGKPGVLSDPSGPLKEGLRVLISDGDSLEAEAILEKVGATWFAKVDGRTMRPISSRRRDG